jgi:hypothetical protein
VFLGAAAWRGTCAVIAEAFKKANKQERMVTRSQGGWIFEGFNQEGEKRIAEVKMYTIYFCAPSALGSAALFSSDLHFIDGAKG